MTFWLLRIHDGVNFVNSSKYGVWGICKSRKSFIKQAKPGDILAFIKCASKGQIIAFAEFTSQYDRECNTLIDLYDDTMMGWKQHVETQNTKWDNIIFYKNLRNVSNCGIFTNVKGSSPLVNYDKKKIKKIIL